MVEIVQIVLLKKRLKSNEIAEILDKPVKTLERHVPMIKQMGIIEFVGSNKTGGYQLTRKLKKLLPR